MAIRRPFDVRLGQDLMAGLGSSADQRVAAVQQPLNWIPKYDCPFWAALIAGFGFLANASNAADRLTVEGTAIVFNTDAVALAEDDTPEIVYADVNLFGDLVMNNPEVDSVIVSGGGGSTSAAYDISNKITEFGLSTIARNNCSSACSIIFLAGSRREIEPGARLGFHRSFTSAKDHKDFYQENKSAAGWADEFAYAKHSYEDGQIFARNFIDYVVKRGVALDFALRALTYGQRDMWYPDEDTLKVAGVITGED